MHEHQAGVTVIASAPHATANLWVWAFNRCGCNLLYSVALPPDAVQDWIMQWMDLQREVAAGQMEAWR